MVVSLFIFEHVSLFLKKKKLEQLKKRGVEEKRRPYQTEKKKKEPTKRMLRPKATEIVFVTGTSKHMTCPLGASAVWGDQVCCYIACLRFDRSPIARRRPQQWLNFLIHEYSYRHDNFCLSSELFLARVERDKEWPGMCSLLNINILPSPFSSVRDPAHAD